MWLDEIVTYTPEIVNITLGDPVEAKVVGISVNNVDITIQLPDGTQKSVEKRLCKAAP